MRYVLCLNEARKKAAKLTRDETIAKLSAQLDRWRPTQNQDAGEIDRALGKIFQGYNSSSKCGVLGAMAFV